MGERVAFLEHELVARNPKTPFIWTGKINFDFGRKTISYTPIKFPSFPMSSNIRSILKETFGLQDFREGQEDIIQSVVSGHDAMVFMPTGGGKSLTYQIPGMALNGITIVISPLISLMKDQIDKLREL